MRKRWHFHTRTRIFYETTLVLTNTQVIALDFWFHNGKIPGRSVVLSLVFGVDLCKLIVGIPGVQGWKNPLVSCFG